MAKADIIDIAPEDTEADEFLLGPEELEDGGLVYKDDEANLVPLFSNSVEGREALKSISEAVMDDWDTNWEAMSEYRKEKADEWKIFCGKMEPKDFPWQDCANMNVPIMLENISRLTMRAELELFGDWQKFMGVAPVTPSKEDQKVAKILSHHGNWQINNDMPDFKRQQRRGMLMFFLNGDVSSHSYYDSRRRQNRHETLTTDQLVVPYTYVSTMPDYSDCPFIAKMFFVTRHEMEAKVGEWFGVSNVLAGGAPTWEGGPETDLRDAEAEVQGIVTPDSNDRGSYKLIHYEGWMTLPNQPDQRYCQIIMDYESGQLFDVHIHEEINWKDRERVKRQEVELKDYWTQVDDFESNQQLMAEAEVGMAQADMSMEQRMDMDMGKPTQEMGVRPIPPPWMKNRDDRSEKPDPSHYEPIHMFSHGICIESLTGIKGLGFGRIQADFNIAANTMLSQFIDGATLNNASGLITTDLVTFESPMSMRPGAVNKVSGVDGKELKNNIMEMQSKPASAQLIQGVERAYDWGQSSIQAPAVLSGEAGKSGETFRGLSTRVEQATKQLSAATGHFAEYETQILKNNARLNSLFLDDEEIFATNDHMTDELMEMRVTRDMYRQNYDVTFRSDLKFTPEAQRVSEAEALASAVLEAPQLQTNAALVYAVVKDVFEARGKDYLVPLLGTQPVTPTQPFSIMPPPMPGMPPGGAPAGGPPAPPPPTPPGPGGPTPGGQ